MNPEWQKITVTPDTSKDLFAFNLEKASTKDNLEERIIPNGGRICCYGRLINNQGNKILKAQLLMGG